MESRVRRVFVLARCVGASLRRRVARTAAAGPTLAGWRPIPPTYFLSRRLGVAYLQIPKAACSTFQAALLAHEDPERYRALAPRLERSVFDLHHTPGLLEQSGDASELLRFTFTRHPFARVVSFYRNQVARDFGPEPDEAALERLATLRAELEASGLEHRMSFRDLVDALLEDGRAARNRHLRRQVDFLWSPRGPNVDYLGKLEELSRHHAFLGQYLGHTPASLPHLNASGVAGWRDFEGLSPAIGDALARHYRSDLALLGYPR